MARRASTAGPDIPVDLVCPGCGHAWREAIIRPGAWWAGGLSPEKTAAHTHCPKCDHPPPMRLAADA